MHPAYSVIFFTTASGAGYGLLVWLAVFAAAGFLPPALMLGLTALGLALALIGTGLLSSTLHLGRPERFLYALTQWRSSWLSREGVLAMLTFVPAGLFAIGWVFFGQIAGWPALMGVIAATLSLVTVYVTSMIYASLKPIRQWYNALVPPAYLALALMSGALIFVVIARAFGIFLPLYGAITLVAIAIAWLIKFAYWTHIDTTPSRSTLATATGLKTQGSVRLLEMPHTEENFIMREMGYRIARTHARKLRFIVHLALFVIPLVLTLLSLFAAPGVALLAAGLAVVSAGLGLLTERWLFFAEATHLSMIYYGRAA